MTEYKPASYLILEPHPSWATAENGYIPINTIASRVYDRPYDSLRGCRRDDDRMLNEYVKLFHLESDEDYAQALEDFDEPTIYLGFDRTKDEEVFKEGLTQLEYWRSIHIAERPEDATVGPSVPEGTDLEGAAFAQRSNADRYFTPSLHGVLADLIRRGELPRANYIFRYWW